MILCLGVDAMKIGALACLFGTVLGLTACGTNDHDGPTLDGRSAEPATPADGKIVTAVTDSAEDLNADSVVPDASTTDYPSSIDALSADDIPLAADCTATVDVLQYEANPIFDSAPTDATVDIALLCAPGYYDCDGLTANGCEANLATDSANCGTCGNSCALPHSITKCVDGVCVLGSGICKSACQYDGCETGYGNCDGLASNGCESYLATRDNCGSCGAKCTDQYRCLYTQGAPMKNYECRCDTCVGTCCTEAKPNCSMGTCYNFSSDPMNCGIRGNACSAGQQCVGGRCL